MIVDHIGTRTYYQISLSTVDCRWSTEGLVWGLWLLNNTWNKKGYPKIPFAPRHIDNIVNDVL